MKSQRFTCRRLKRALNASSDYASLAKGIGLSSRRASLLTAAAFAGLVASPAYAQTN